MEDAAPAFALAVWYGLSVPITVHVGAVLLQRNPRTPLSWVIRLVGVPVALLGQIGMAAAFGLHRAFANSAALGILLGLAVYYVCAWLNHRSRRSRHLTAR